MNFTPATTAWLAGTMIVYVIVLYIISIYTRSKIKTNEDYIVAGRRLPLSLAWMTLFATWFGAGSLLSTTDHVYENGIADVSEEPFGVGFCLILTGLFFAAKLWNLKLLTIGDFFRKKFGTTAEVV